MQSDVIQGISYCTMARTFEILTTKKFVGRWHFMGETCFPP